MSALRHDCTGSHVGDDMNRLEDGAVKYQIDLERYKNGQANEIVGLLDEANSEIKKFIMKTGGVHTKKRYLEIARKLKDVSKTLKENADGNMDIDGLIDYELRKQKSLLESVKGEILKIRGIDATVGFLYPTREQIKTAALFKPVADTMTYQSYLDGIESGLYNTWDSAVRTGYLTGQTAQEIVRNVVGSAGKAGQLANPGTMRTFRNYVYGNTRTVLQSFANETRNRIYEKNEDLFGDGEYKYEYLATLDSRTCMVCGNDDGRLFKSLKDAPQLPMHRGCRCLLIPYFGDDGGTRASPDGYVSSKVTFEEWLSGQDENTQLEVLGRTRYELFRSGEPMSQFVDNGKALTIEELNKRIDIKYVFGKNMHEPDLSKMSAHLVNHRAEERGVTVEDVIDSVRNPLKRGQVREKDGTYLIIGERASVGVSAFDGTITTACRTGKDRLRKYKDTDNEKNTK